jgi:hypothetical protein
VSGGALGIPFVDGGRRLEPSVQSLGETLGELERRLGFN